MSLLSEIGDYLVAQNLVEGSSGWRLFHGTGMPAEPDQVVVLMEAAGLRPEMSVPELTYPQFQVTARGAKLDYDTVRDKLKEIYDLLHGGNTGRRSLGGVTYHHILALSDPIPLGLDDNERPEIVQNYHTAREE